MPKVEPLWITNKLKEEKGIHLEFLTRIKTNMTDTYRFAVVDEISGRAVEYIRIWSSSMYGKKLFIESRYEGEYIGVERLKLVEKAIVEAVKHSPKNRIPNLLKPIKFVCNAPDVEKTSELEVSGEELQDKFLEATEEINTVHNDEKLSFYALHIPNMESEELVLSLFEELDSTESLVENDNGTKIRFYAMKPRMIDDKKALMEAQKQLEELGIEAEIVPSVVLDTTPDINIMPENEAVL